MNLKHYIAVIISCFG